MSLLTDEDKKQLESKLVDSGVISAIKLEDLRGEAASKGTPFITYLTKQGVIDEETLTRYTAEVLDMPYVNLSQAKTNEETLKIIDQDTAERFMAVPLGEMDGRMAVAMLDPSNVQAVDFLSSKIGMPIKAFKASESGIRNIISQYKARLSSEYAINDDYDSQKDSNEEDSEIKIISQDSPVSKILSSVMDYAVKLSASDVHIEPQSNDLRIRVRVDGVLREAMKLPKSTEAALISKVKILSKLKIDEHRVPQDGQATLKILGKQIDLRIAIAPVIWGEQIVIRLLDKSGISFKLEDMGYGGYTLETIRRGLVKPNGMILTSGPTGSGKSTSMYALLQEIISDKTNIVTLEDPVEYKIAGINQIQVNPAVGLTFASGLRSVLRQDPDVIMVGEIRDKETAELAVQAALTGHLVLSTVHTNSSAGVLPRLIDMGIEPFLIASTVNTVIGQRLVRRLNKPVITYNSSTNEAASIKQTLQKILPKTEAQSKQIASSYGYSNLPLLDSPTFTLAKGTKDHIYTDGYKGRIGLFESFEVGPDIEELIVKRATSSDVMRAARKQGMITMREDGYLKALSGQTSLQEVNRVTALDNN